MLVAGCANTQAAVGRAELDAAWVAHETKPEPRSEFELAQALERAQLPFSAFVFYDAILKEGRAHSRHNGSVAALVRLQSKLGDAYLIPSELDRHYDPVAWATLPEATLARINLMLAVIDLRKGRFDEALEFTAAVAPGSPVRARALYAEALASSDPRAPKRDLSRAIDALERLVRLDDPEQEELARMKELATLALGRLHFEEQRFAEAVKWYAAAEKLDGARADAVFEGAFARFQNDDLAGALAQLERVDLAEHPEAVILEASIHHFAGDLAKVAPALRKLEASRAVAAKLQPVVEAPSGAAPALAMFERLELPMDARLAGVVGLVAQIDRELAAARDLNPRLAQELTAHLGSSRAVLAQAAEKLAMLRLTSRYDAHRGWEDVAIIIDLETEALRGNTEGELQGLLRLVSKVDGQTATKPELLFRVADRRRARASELREPAAAKLQLEEAVRVCDVVLREHPDYPRNAEVLFAEALALEALEDAPKARTAYERLLRDFPRWERLGEARDRLTALGAKKD